jgi:hypothetical protein
VGTGHVFKSTDAGENFTDITGNLPDTPANWVIVRGGQLIVGTDIGVFASTDTNGSSWAVLGNGLPNVPITHLVLKPGDPNTLVAATYGRGVYLYHFNAPPPASAVQGAHTACLAGAGFRHFTAKAAKHRRGLKVRAIGKTKGTVRVNLYRYAVGRHVTRRKRVRTFRNPRKALSLSAKHLRNGWYAVQASASAPGVTTITRSDTFHVAHGKFFRRADFYGRARCGDLSSFHLSSPVFGGTTRRSLTATYRVGRAGNVSIVLFKGRKVIRRFRTVHAVTGKTYRLRIRPRGLKVGSYTVRAKLSRLGGGDTRTLLSRRL